MKIFKRLSELGLMVTLFIGASNSSAQSLTGVDVHALGPQVGDFVPDFSLPDQDGVLHDLDSILGPNGAMLLFHRSADW